MCGGAVAAVATAAPRLERFELRRLRSDTRTRDVPIISSADATPSRVHRLRAAEVDDYITEPLDVDGFLAAVARVLLEDGE